jgi:hypothetical protein
MSLTPEKPLLRTPAGMVSEWCKNRISRFAVLSGIDVSTHFSIQLVAIMSRLNYRPKQEHLAGTQRLSAEQATPEFLGLVRIACYHVSSEMLADLDAELELAETDSRVEVIKPGDGTVWVDGKGNMVYTDHEQEKPDLTKDHGTGWASW